MHQKALSVLFILLSCILSSKAQQATALIKGRVTDDAQRPLENVTISVKDISVGTRTNDKGDFSLSVPANRTNQIKFSLIGYDPKIIFKRLAPSETVSLTIELKSNSNELRGITVQGDKKSQDGVSISKLRIQNYTEMPSINNSIEDLLKVFLSPKNELSSQYNVRGGNFDENLVYINDFEVYRPFLARSGQQEGLSIINPDLVAGVNFSTGGFQSKYGDKMSSVLDITYKRPKEFAGSVNLSLLGAAAHIEGVAKNRRLAYMIGLRQKSNQYILQAQQTKGVYNPSFTDVQAFLNYQFNTDWYMDVFANYARNRFDFIPESSTQSFGLINKAFQLRTYYQGKEIDKFDSRYGGVSFTHLVNNKTTLKFIASGFQTDEAETYDIQGEYLLGEIETDLSKENFGDIKYALGTGIIHNYARNYLKVNVGSLAHKGSHDHKKHFIQWGVNADFVSISDRLNEWERRDSAGFTQPANDTAILMFKRYKTSQDFTYERLSAYLQDNVDLSHDSIKITLNYGLRANYSLLNNELLVSPRAQISYQPHWKREVIFRGATGIYSQPPFYREMRDLNGNVNKDVDAQKSYHAVAGFDYNFKGLGKRPFKFTTDIYYKYMWDLIPYEVDNVRIRYFGRNNARGFAYGSEFRLYGDIVDGAESWLSVGLMKTSENLSDDTYTYKSRIDGSDSVTIKPGFIPRPTDSRVSFGMFFSDYLRRNKNFKAHILGFYSTGLPFGVPDQQRFGDTLRIPSYKRVDIGFSALLLDGSKKERPRYSYFRNVKSIWVSLEVFNLLGIQNTLSYLWIQDQSTNARYAVPNRLTARLLNVKVVTRF